MQSSLNHAIGIIAFIDESWEFIPICDAIYTCGLRLRFLPQINKGHQISPENMDNVKSYNIIFLSRIVRIDATYHC